MNDTKLTSLAIYKSMTKAIDEKIDKLRERIEKNSEKHEELTGQLEKERLKLNQLKISGNATTEQINEQQKVVDELTGKIAKNESAQQTNITALQTTQSELLKTETEITSVNNEISKNISLPIVEDTNESSNNFNIETIAPADEPVPKAGEME